MCTIAASFSFRWSSAVCSSRLLLRLVIVSSILTMATLLCTCERYSTVICATWSHPLCLQCTVPAVLVACGYIPCVCNVQCRECWLLVVTLLVFAMHSNGSAGCLWLHSLCLQYIVPRVLVACGYAPCLCNA